MKQRTLPIVGALLAAALVTLAAALPGPRPAVRIEPPQPQLGGAYAVGAGPIAMRYVEWQSESTWSDSGATGTLSGIFRLRPPSYELIAIEHDNFVAGYLYPKTSSQVGDGVAPDALQPNVQPDGSDANFQPEYWAVRECYIPLYLFGLASPAGRLERHVCAFVRVRIEPFSPPPSWHTAPGDLFMKITKLPNQLHPGRPWIALRNASSRFDGTQPPVVFPNSSLDWTDLLEALNDLPPVPSGPSVLIPDSRVYVR